MAQVSFDAVPAENQGGGNFNSVEFFTLRNDGDEALVRILHDSTDSFNIFTVHDNLSVNGKRRKVNCLRSPKDPVEMCPLCASGNNIVNRIYINMLVYGKDANGQMTITPVVWERSFAYASRLKVLIDEYGPLSQSIFKIKRSGAAGSMETKYDILYCNPKIYPDNLYPIANIEKFEGYSALGSVIMNKTAADMNVFLNTGAFPAASQNENANAAPQQMSYQPKVETNAPAYSEVPPAIPVNPAPTTGGYVPQGTSAPSAAPQRWNTAGAPAPAVESPSTTGNGPGPRYY